MCKFWGIPMESPFTSAVAKEERDASEHKTPDFLQIKFAASDTLNLSYIIKQSHSS